MTMPKLPTPLFAVEPKDWTPHAYQKKAVKFLLNHGAAALLLDPGLGKSSVTLAALKLLKAKFLNEKTLVIAPLRVIYSVWPAELKKWSDFSGLKAVILHGPEKEAALASEADLYLINPEGLDWLLKLEKTKGRSGKTRVTLDLKRWKGLGFDTLVIDELTKFKHPSTNRYKALKQVRHTFSRIWGLTGSPAANGLMDLFGQFFILDGGRSLGKFITHFRNEYFDLGYDGFTWSLKKGADQLIFERIKPLSLRMAASDYLELPELIENDIYVDLPEKAAAIYKHLEDDLIAQIDKKVVVAANAASASMKCRQVASGGIYLDADVEALVKAPKGQREWTDLHSAKVDALEELIEQLQGQPLLVAYDFKHDLTRLQERFGDDLPYIGGGVTAKRSAELEQLWNAGKLPVLLGHPASIAHGLNLQEAGCHVCWHTPTWNLEHYSQFIARVHRQGNKSRQVTVHHLLARGTIDEDMMAALRGKEKGQQALFKALRARRR